MRLTKQQRRRKKTDKSKQREKGASKQWRKRGGGGRNARVPITIKGNGKWLESPRNIFSPFFLAYLLLSFFSFSLPQRPRLGVAAAECIRKEKRQLGKGKNQFGKNGASGDRIKRKGEGERHQHFDVVVVCGYVGRGRRAKC